MATTKPAEPTLQGVPAELRLKFYKLVAATPEKRIILSRKFAQAVKNQECDGSLCKQAFSAIVQHPLSMTCRQIREEFQSEAHDAFSRSQCQSYDFVVNNFDMEQVRLFREFECNRRATGASWWVRVDATRDFDVFHWLTNATVKLVFQLDRNVVSSVVVLTDLMSDLCKDDGERRSSDLLWHAVVNDCTVLSNYRDQWTGIVDKSKTMTLQQAKEANKAFDVYRDCQYGNCRPRKKSRRDAHKRDQLLDILVNRFLGIVSGYI